MSAVLCKNEGRLAPQRTHMTHLSAVAAASLKVKSVSQLIGPQSAGEWHVPYRRVRLDGAIERHRRAALLCNFRVLAMKTALLILLHAHNLLLQSRHFF